MLRRLGTSLHYKYHVKLSGGDKVAPFDESGGGSHLSKVAPGCFERADDAKAIAAVNAGMAAKGGERTFAAARTKVRVAEKRTLGAPSKSGINSAAIRMICWS